MPKLSETAIDIMSAAYPDLLGNKDFILGVMTKEEERFRQTLKTGLTILEDELSSGTQELAGPSAFLLHDTYGFPLELTQEIAGERNVRVDVAGFEQAMGEQRDRAKSARKGAKVSESTIEAYRQVMETHGITDFVGYESTACEAKVLAVIPVQDGEQEDVDVFLDITPFYAESGGQVGDVGKITTPTGEIEVLDTTFALPGLRKHIGKIIRGSVTVGQTALAEINVEDRDATRRNHTATHILHWALREVLGDHVKQAGSLVSPERLRFDFSHYAPVSSQEIERIERLANEQVFANSLTKNYETSKDEATAAGAIAFFGDKYGDMVRVLEAGKTFELCGGTHVKATGDIGIIKVVSESSIGSNLRRIEAVTGENTFNYLLDATRTLSDASELLGTQPNDIVSTVQRKIDEVKALQEEIKQLRSAQARSRAGELVALSDNGNVVSRVDGLSPNDLRELALAIRQNASIRAVVLGGVTDTGGVALVAAIGNGLQVPAGDLIKDAAKAVGGGGGGKGDIATAGGKNPAALDEALNLARAALGRVSGS